MGGVEGRMGGVEGRMGRGGEWGVGGGGEWEGEGDGGGGVFLLILKSDLCVGDILLLQI